MKNILKAKAQIVFQDWTKKYYNTEVAINLSIDKLHKKSIFKIIYSRESKLINTTGQ